MEEKRVEFAKPKVSKRHFEGHVYNVTTETGNLFVEDILVHNSGGLGTPPHLRVESGLIHKSSGGVLFVDELATLSQKAQQELLTAMQEKKYSITGQSEMSSGAMTRTEVIPCFPHETFLLTENGYTWIGEFVDSIMSKNFEKANYIDGVEFLDLESDVSVPAFSDRKIASSRVTRVYRRKYSGKVFRIKFDDGTELVATPEHPIKRVDGFVEAKNLHLNDVVESENGFFVIGSGSVVKTYSRENQRIAVAFEQWRGSGERMLPAVLGVDYKTVSGWKKGLVPHALKAVNFLSGKELLPLKPQDERLPIIARIAGALFGDGGIDGRRFSRIYFCTGSESFEDLEEFKKDIVLIFGNGIESSITIRKTVSKRGSGLELSVNNSFVARFFYALGVPKGDKVAQSFSVPSWIKMSRSLEKEFFSALLTCELYGNIRSTQNVPSFVMAKVERLEKEHFTFLNEIRAFLQKNMVVVRETKQVKRYIKRKGLAEQEAAGTYGFKINSKSGNIVQLAKAVNFYYASRKKQAILKAAQRAGGIIKNQKKLQRLKEEAMFLRNEGKSIKVVAKETGLAKNTVWRMVEKTYNKYSSADKQKVFDLLSHGIISKVIAKKLCIPYTTVIYWKNNYYGGEA